MFTIFRILHVQCICIQKEKNYQQAKVMAKAPSDRGKAVCVLFGLHIK